MLFRSPRFTGEYVRRLGSDDSGDDASDGVADDATDAGDVTLVGVVHNHPASKHRIRTMLDEVDPAVLALELRRCHSTAESVV